MKRKKKLDFTPFSQADVNAMLAAVPTVDEKIKAYRVTQWFNSTTNEILFGIEAKDESGGWFNMCNGSRALIFSDKKLANAVCRAFKKQLNSVLA